MSLCVQTGMGTGRRERAEGTLWGRCCPWPCGLHSRNTRVRQLWWDADEAPGWVLSTLNSSYLCWVAAEQSCVGRGAELSPTLSYRRVEGAELS